MAWHRLRCVWTLQADKASVLCRIQTHLAHSILATLCCNVLCYLLLILVQLHGIKSLYS